MGGIKGEKNYIKLKKASENTGVREEGSLVLERLNIGFPSLFHARFVSTEKSTLTLGHFILTKLFNHDG